MILRLSQLVVKEVGPLIKTLPALPKGGDIKSLLVSRDADDNPDGVFESLYNYLDRSDFEPPSEVGVLSGGSPKVGICVFPDGTSEGMLEDLCVQAVESDYALECVNTFLECVESEEEIRNKSKAMFYAWLSVQNKPDIRLGQAAEYGLIDFHSDAFTDLKALLAAM